MEQRRWAPKQLRTIAPSRPPAPPGSWPYRSLGTCSGRDIAGAPLGGPLRGKQSSNNVMDGVRMQPMNRNPSAHPLLHSQGQPAPRCEQALGAKHPTRSTTRKYRDFSGAQGEPRSRRVRAGGRLVRLPSDREISFKESPVSIRNPDHPNPYAQGIRWVGFVK